MLLIKDVCNALNLFRHWKADNGAICTVTNFKLLVVVKRQRKVKTPFSIYER